MFEKDILIKGKCASYAKFLSKTTEKLDKDKKVAGVFDRVIDVYMVAPILGVIYGLKKEIESESNEQTRIFTEVVLKEQGNLKYIFQLVMLTDNSTGLDNESKIARAFKEDKDEEKAAENMKLFTQYVYGGIEYLYEQITLGAMTQDDYIAKIDEVVSNFKEEQCLQ